MNSEKVADIKMKTQKNRRSCSLFISILFIFFILVFCCPGLLHSLQMTAEKETVPFDKQEYAHENPCSKNVIVYFDASHSMIEKVGGESIMQFMLRFMKEAAGNPDLFKDGDRILLKKFAEKTYPFLEIGGEFDADDATRDQTISRIDQALYQYERLKISSEHNDYLNLLEDIRLQILSIPPKGNVMNTIIIFSDFLYDPPFGQEALLGHKAGLEQKLFEYRDIFDSYHYRLILIYKKNPNIANKGVDVFDAFSRNHFTKSIVSPGNISQLIEDLKREIVQPVRVVEPESRFLYKNGILELHLTIENPNCDEIRASSIEILSINDVADEAIALSSPTVAPEGSKTFKPLGTKTIEIPLNNPPPFNKIVEDGYYNKTYKVVYLVNTQWGSEEDFFEIPLREEDFEESFTVEIEDLAFIDHVFSRYDKLFVKLKLDGQLFNNATLKVRPELIDSTMRQIEPIFPIKIQASGLMEQKRPVFVYKVRRNGGFNLAGIEEAAQSLKLNWDIIYDNKSIDLKFQGAKNSEEMVEKTIETSHYKNYVIPEIVIFMVLVLLAAVIRIFFHFKRGKTVYAANHP